MLELAAKLRDARERPDISLERVDLAGGPSLDDWRARARARSEIVLQDEKRRLSGLGLIDEDWNARTDQLPDDMLPSSESSVET